MPRRKPYSFIGIKRVPCVGCGKPAHAQWNVCADNNRPRAVCKTCDYEINRLVMEFIFGKALSRNPLKKYKEKLFSERESSSTGAAPEAGS